MKKLIPLLALVAFISTGCCCPRLSGPYYKAGNFPWQYSPRSGLQGKYWMNADPDQGWPIGLSSYPVPVFP